MSYTAFPLRSSPGARSRPSLVRRPWLATGAWLVATVLAACGGGGTASDASNLALASSGASSGTGSTSGSTTSSGGTTSGGTTGTPIATAGSCSTATASASANRVIQADPSNYLARVRALVAGDTLVLAPGTYDDPSDVPGLPLFDMNGTPTKPIVITGPESGPRPVLLGRSTHNTVRLSNASYVVVRNLEIDGRDLGGAGVATQGLTHHVTIENLVIRGVGGDQQVVGISTVGSPTWNWVICGNTIIGAGTGMYLGNSDGSDPFVAGLIERNLIRDTIGYNMQVKHQVDRPALAGMPTTPQRTVIRHNVFAKSGNSSTGSLARPNVLVGHFPPSGNGSSDRYEIYGNFFYQNPTEALFQGEGNIAFYANVMVNDTGDAVNIQPHHDVPKAIDVFGNTVLARGSGVRITGGATGYAQRAFGNAIFAASPLSGGEQRDNVTASRASAATYLNAPDAPLGTFDAFPRPGALRGTAIDVSPATGFTDFGKDFGGQARDWTLRGAYAGEGANPGWLPKLEIKP
ncbi:MAG: hypothetical protein KF755_03745 [Burkholderiaceae bacterium]|nr:hypothetical protein [Burkholderiaceae bacterium]